MRRLVSIALLSILAAAAAAADKPAKPKKQPEKRDATPADALQTLPGFAVELLHSSSPAEEGSWISMTRDHKGRLLIGGQHGQRVVRVTLKGGKVDRVEKLDLPITEVMGMLYAFDSLYVVGSGPRGYGVYRCKDTTNQDRFDEVNCILDRLSGGEHGSHGIVLGPDQKLYLICGNHNPVPAGLAESSPHRNYHEDQLLPRQWDGNGHAAGILAPGGYVLRADPDGKKWEMVLAGFRNAYDIAFNGDGELFTFDSDMEWDWGMPWYRPIRVNHCTSAAEFGWRSGTGKWPSYYPDSLPAVTEIGIGSPTGVAFGTGAKFPAKYQRALYVLDWTYGRLIAVHLTPAGAGYTGTWENFVAPKGLTGNGPKSPLNLTDVVIGDDGAMYFVTGGRGTQAGLYRVTYTGAESTDPAVLKSAAGVNERALRHTLETFHSKHDPAAVETAWVPLGSHDRYLRYAARLAVERQPVAEWKAKALAETRPTAALQALLALARTGTRDDQPALLAALDKFPLATLDDEQQLEKLRVLQLTCIRQGRPGGEAARKIVAELDARFPVANESVNRETAELLIFFQPRDVAAKILKHMAAAKTQQDLIHYLFHLRTLPIGWWTLDQRKEYLSYFKPDRKKPPFPPEFVAWFTAAGRGPDNGASYGNFMKHFIDEAVAFMSEAERAELAPQIAAITKTIIPTYDTKPRPLVKVWAMSDVLPQLEKAAKGRNFDRGRRAYFDAQCVKCHRLGTEGGAVGPDLTAVASRFASRDILESIIEPSKVISDQYQHTVVTTTTGKVIVGRVMDETADAVVLQPNPLAADRVTVKKAEIESREASKVSPMPAHLVDGLTADEILDLIAYLESGGNRNHRAFRN